MVMRIKDHDFNPIFDELSKNHPELKFELMNDENDRVVIWIDFGIIKEAIYDESGSEESAANEIEEYFSNIEQKISDNNPNPGFEFDTQIECGPSVYATVMFKTSEIDYETNIPIEKLEQFLVNTKSSLETYR